MCCDSLSSHSGRRGGRGRRRIHGSRPHCLRATTLPVPTCQPFTPLPFGDSPGLSSTSGASSHIVCLKNISRWRSESRLSIVPLETDDCCGQVLDSTKKGGGLLGWMSGACHRASMFIPRTRVREIAPPLGSCDILLPHCVTLKYIESCLEAWGGSFTPWL